MINLTQILIGFIFGFLTGLIVYHTVCKQKWSVNFKVEEIIALVILGVWVIAFLNTLINPTFTIDASITSIFGGVVAAIFGMRAFPRKDDEDSKKENN